MKFENHFYTVTEVADVLNLTVRAIQRRCSAQGVDKYNGNYLIPQSLFNQWKSQRVKDCCNEQCQEELLPRDFDKNYQERKEELYDRLNECFNIIDEVKPKIENLEATIRHLKEIVEDEQTNWQVAEYKVYDYFQQLRGMGVDETGKDFEDYINSKPKEKLPF